MHLLPTGYSEDLHAGCFQKFEYCFSWEPLWESADHNYLMRLHWLRSQELRIRADLVRNILTIGYDYYLSNLDQFSLSWARGGDENRTRLMYLVHKHHPDNSFRFSMTLETDENSWISAYHEFASLAPSNYYLLIFANQSPDHYYFHSA